MTDKEIVDRIAAMLDEHAKWCEEHEDDWGTYATDSALSDWEQDFSETVQCLMAQRDN